MLFNSYSFLFGFLPAVLLIYQLVSRFHRNAVVLWLGVASLLFYGFWRPGLLAVLCGSILFNFLFVNLISRRIPNSIGTTLLLWLAIAGNLGALCWFKYLFSLLNFFSRSMHAGGQWKDVALPLGISFFTFTQIAYLVDLQQGIAVQDDFSSYLLFVTFFPHLIAGPILHHKDIMPQFQRNREYGLQFQDMAVGFTWFIMGMFKKTFIADNLALRVIRVFGTHGQVSRADAWAGVLSYAMQLYFDFSGYSDMACGLARMFSIDFPLNFASPYKSASIIDFWQRWHMTLSQYIGSYLYSPLQFWIGRRMKSSGAHLSRRAQVATVKGFTQLVIFPTIFTMTIAGIWHGAGSQFIIFGLLHGIYLSVNHGWRIIRQQRKIASPQGVSRHVLRVACVLLTFSCVVLAEVFFRAPSVHDAMLLLRRMTLCGEPTNPVNVGSIASAYEAIAVCLVIVWGFPNTQQILARFKPALRLAPSDELPRRLPIFWKPTVAWALLSGAVMLVAIAQLENPSAFLYFQF